MSWSEMPPPPISRSGSSASVRIFERHGRAICNVSLRKAISGAAGFKDKTALRVLQGFGESQGRLRLCADPQGPYRCREYRSGTLCIALPLPDGCAGEVCKALNARATLVSENPSVVEMVLPHGLFRDADPVPVPAPKPRAAPLAKRSPEPEIVSTPRRAGDPEIGKAGPPPGAVALPGRNWKPGAGAAKG